MVTKTRVAVTAMVLSISGILGIQYHEATPTKVYQDVVGINTVCTGHVTQLPVGTIVTVSVCSKYLLEDTTMAQDTIKRYVKVPVTQDQFDALTSLVFNIGPSAFAKSSLLRDLNTWKDDSKACMRVGADFMAWNRAGGQVVRGLTNRRRDESTLWLSGC